MIFESRKNLKIALAHVEGERDIHMANVDALSMTNSELRRELENVKATNESLEQRVKDLERKLRDAEDEGKSFEMWFANENNEATQMDFLLLKYKEMNRRVAALEEIRKQDLEDRVRELKMQINTASMQLPPIAYIPPTYR